MATPSGRTWRASLACVAIGLSSTFGRLMARVPAPIVSAMLAGVLFRFGTGYFAAPPGSPARARVTVLVALMVATYFVARSRGSRLTIVWTALVGGVGRPPSPCGSPPGRRWRWRWCAPRPTRPTPHAGAAIGLALPLLAIALSSAASRPGYGVLKEAAMSPA